MERSSRITTEADAEHALGEAVAHSLAAQAWPGVFSGGKEVVSTEAKPNYLRFEFNDGSSMTIRGQFDIEYGQPHLALVEDDVIDGEYIEEDETPQLGSRHDSPFSELGPHGEDLSTS